MAVLPIGYGDGYRRGLANRADVLISGRRHPVVGTISMDNITVEVGDAEVAIGDSATLIGADGERARDRRGARPPARHDQLRDHVRDLGARPARARALVSALAERLERATAVRTVLGALPEVDAWLVGGTVRDALRDDPKLDEPDLVVAGDAEPVARELAERVGAFVFPLSERFGAWRVIARDRTWQSDITPARGSIEEDLALRDFTINAMAVPGDRARPADRPARRRGGPGRAPDPRGRCSARSRTTRCACCGWRASRATWTSRSRPARCALAAAESARIEEVAPERSFYELRRLVAGPRPRRGIELMDSVGLVAALLPGAGRG